MEILWIVLGLLLIIVGIAGSLLPVLPGPPIAFLGLWMQQLRVPQHFTTKFILIWLALVVIVVVLDYLIPIWGTKKFGGSKYGIWGCSLGFIAAFWMGPLGIIVGPFVGAFLGELYANKTNRQALKAALGSFIGFLFGSLFKIVACIMMGYYVVVSFL